jgi:hypothetical protein
MKLRLRKTFDGSHPVRGCIVVFILGLIVAYIALACYTVIWNNRLGCGHGGSCLSIGYIPVKTPPLIASSRHSRLLQ